MQYSTDFEVLAVLVIGALLYGVAYFGLLLFMEHKNPRKDWERKVRLQDAVDSIVSRVIRVAVVLALLRVFTFLYV